MALLKCKECNGSVSSDAKACPGCGAAPPKSMGRLQVLFIGVCVIGIAAVVSQPSNSTPTPVAKPLTADEVAYKAKEAAFEVAEAARDKERSGLAARSVAAVMSKLRDPDSAKFTYVGVNDGATVACLQYRARNGFGGMNQDIAVIANNKATSTAADWKRYCSEPLRDMLAAADAAR